MSLFPMLIGALLLLSVAVAALLSFWAESDDHAASAAQPAAAAPPNTTPSPAAPPPYPAPTSPAAPSEATAPHYPYEKPEPPLPEALAEAAKLGQSTLFVYESYTEKRFDCTVYWLRGYVQEIKREALATALAHWNSRGESQRSAGEGIMPDVMYHEWVLDALALAGHVVIHSELPDRSQWLYFLEHRPPSQEA